MNHYFFLPDIMTDYYYLFYFICVDILPLWKVTFSFTKYFIKYMKYDCFSIAIYFSVYLKEYFDEWTILTDLKLGNRTLNNFFVMECYLVSMVILSITNCKGRICNIYIFFLFIKVFYHTKWHMDSFNRNFLNDFLKFNRNKTSRKLNSVNIRKVFIYKNI